MVIELGDLVDVCSAVPAIHLLRESYPDAQLDVLVSSPADDLLGSHSCVDELIVLGSGGELGLAATNRMAGLIKNRRYEMLLDFSGTKTSGLIAWRSNALERFSFTAPRVSVGVRRAYTHTLRLGEEARNRTYQNLLLCGEVCGHTRPQGVSLPVSEEQALLTDTLFHERFEGDKRIVGLGFGDEVQKKDLEFMHALCERIAADGRFDLLLIPLPAAWDHAAGIAKRFSRGDLLPPRIQENSEVVSLMRECHIAITTSTLVSHMCYLNDIKTLLLLLHRVDPGRLPIETMDQVKYKADSEHCIDEIEQKLVAEFYPILS